MTPPPPPFSRSVAVTEMMEASARVPMDQWSPHQSLQSASIVPVGGQLSVGGRGGDTYRDVDSCKSKNNRRKQRNEEKVARLREKKVTQCIICISLCFYIYIFFIWTLFQHTNKKKYKTIVGKMLIKGNQVYLFAVVKFSSKKYHIKAHLKIKGGWSEQSNLAKLQCRWMGLHRIFIIHLINT